MLATILKKLGSAMSETASHSPPVLCDVEKKIAEALLLHRRCFAPEGAFCACKQWAYPDNTGGLQWHEHAAQEAAAALRLQKQYLAISGTGELLDSSDYYDPIAHTVNDAVEEGDNFARLYVRYVTGKESVF